MTHAVARHVPVEAGDPLVVVVVGAGPGGTVLLERLTANAGEFLDDRPLLVHLVDPFPPGAGRVWRREQSALVRMNSMASDVTMFTDDTVVCDGPIVPGPSLIEWASIVDDGDLPDPAVAEEVRSLTGSTFPTRRLQAAYLDWTFRRIVSEAPPNVEVRVHGGRAVDVEDRPDGRQRVVVDTGRVITADVVVLALGHLDADPDPESARLAGFAERHGRHYLPPSYTADEDLSAIPAGDDVIVRGLGLAFVDLVVLLTEGRGGRFVPRPDGGLDYVPSGQEPFLHAGSRRGVPYRSKLLHRLEGVAPGPPQFLTEEAVDRLLDGDRPLDFRRDVYPVVAKEVAWGYYRELFTGHPDRVTAGWERFAAEYRALGTDPVALRDLAAAAVPDPDDRLDLAWLDRPLDGLRFESVEDLDRHIAGHIADNLRRAHSQTHSADLGAFTALLSCFWQLPRILSSGRLTTRSRIDDADGWFFGFFSYLASGPPGHRLEELLALQRAGILHFLGAGLRVEADETLGRFVASSASVPGTVVADALVDARLPSPHVERTRDTLIANLYGRGEVSQHVLVGDDGAIHATGLLDVDADSLRLITGGGTPHPRRYALGAPTNRRLAGTFARPRTNAVGFRQTDSLARHLLAALQPAVLERSA